MAIQQQHPILDDNTRTAVETGAFGVFICTPANPFTAARRATLGISDTIGASARANEQTTITAISTNGVSGASLVATWPAGQGFAFEIESMTVSTGKVLILLKPRT